MFLFFRVKGGKVNKKWIVWNRWIYCLTGLHSDENDLYRGNDDKLKTQICSVRKIGVHLSSWHALDLMYPSGEEPVENALKGEARLGR